MYAGIFNLHRDNGTDVQRRMRNESLRSQTFVLFILCQTPYSYAVRSSSIVNGKLQQERTGS
jgi:hypothetical protein